MAESSRSVPQAVSAIEFARVKQQLEELIAGRKMTTNSPSTRVYIHRDPPPEYGAPLKPTKLPEYHGNRVTYPAWRTAVLDIFRIDWNLFGYDNSRAFLMIFSALKGAAAEKAGPFYEAGGVNGTRDPADFLEFLDRLNLDSTRVSRANKELHIMKMREGQRWPDFFAAWCNKVTEARGDFWPDENKISMLENALNDRLTQALAGNHLIPDNDFNEWVRIVNKVAQKVEMADQRSRWTAGRRVNGATQFYNQKNDAPKREFNLEPIQGRQEAQTSGAREVEDLDASGDTMMGGINNTAVGGKERRRAKWKTRAELDNLRKEGKCFRCERRGCTSRNCPLLPARKPKGDMIRVCSLDLPEIDPSVYNLDGVDVVEPNVSEN